LLDLKILQNLLDQDSQAAAGFHSQSFVDEQQKHVIPLSKALVTGIDVQGVILSRVNT
jgi:hypothetical protein